MTLTISNTLYFDAYMKGARSSKFNKWKNPCRELLIHDWVTQLRNPIWRNYYICTYRSPRYNESEIDC